ncbi:MAG: glycosyltransferase [Salinimicrobium sp.]
MFQHYILTRFNLKAENWATTKNNDKALSEEWLKERFDLFENFCFSSVKNQVNQNFKWLVFFDTNTPEAYRQKVEEYRKSYENFLPFFIEGMNSFLPEIIKNIQKLDSEEYVITSRLDNDDCIHERYTEVIQSYFDKQEHQALDIVDGYSLEIGENSRLGAYIQLNNPFMSLIEKKENLKTVWFRKRHGSWKYEKNMTRIRHQRLWLSIIHSKNMENRFLGYGNIDPKKLYEFHISKERTAEIMEDLVKAESWDLLSFKNRINLNLKLHFKNFKTSIGLYKNKN